MVQGSRRQHPQPRQPNDVGHELPLLDPQVAGELWIVAADVLDEMLGVLATDERLDGFAEGWSELERTSRMTEPASAPNPS